MMRTENGEWFGGRDAMTANYLGIAADRPADVDGVAKTQRGDPVALRNARCDTVGPSVTIFAGTGAKTRGSREFFGPPRAQLQPIDFSVVARASALRPLPHERRRTD